MTADEHLKQELDKRAHNYTIRECVAFTNGFRLGVEGKPMLSVRRDLNAYCAGYWTGFGFAGHKS